MELTKEQLNENLKVSRCKNRNSRKGSVVSPVYHVMRVKVGEALKCTVGNSSYFHLLQRLFMHCGRKRKKEIPHRGKITEM